jgi:hypothetical protein
MPLLILAMLSIVLQVSQPASNTNGTQNNSATQQQPSASSLSTKNADSSQEKKHCINSTPSRNDPSPVSGWEKAYVVSNFLLFGAAAIAAGYAYKTLRAVERQAKATEDQLIQTQRAFEFNRDAVKASERADILIDAASLVPANANGVIDGGARLKVTFKNFGRTRARDVSIRIQMFIKGVNLTKGIEELPMMVLGAGQDQTVTFLSFREFLGDMTFKEIIQGKKELWFEASVSYQDAFGDGYVTMDIGAFIPEAMRFAVKQKIAG